MTRKEFLKTMDKIKKVWVNNSDYNFDNEPNCGDFTCHAIEDALGNRICNRSLIRRSYEAVMLRNDDVFDYFGERIAALELFEIIALEEKLYLKF